MNDTARVDVSLTVGEVSETVNVTEAPPAINTSSAEIGRTIQATEITNLPLVERNVYALLDLTPGVQSNNNGIASSSTGTSSLVLGFPEQRTLINGGTDSGTGSVNYYLDGGSNMTNLHNTGNILPNPDAIQEFRVQTNSYNAEYRNQFGGTLGSPMRRDKTFFFFSYSDMRQTTSTFLNNAIVPTDLERLGNFSASATKPTDLANNATFTCNGVSGVICANRLDPIAVKILNNYIPLANLAGSKWQGNGPSPFDTNEYLAKFDHQLNEAHRLSANYFTTAGANTVKAGIGNLPWASQKFNWRQHNLNLSDVWIMSPSKINQAWLTYTRNFGGRLNLPATSLADLGSAFTIQGTPSLPQITVSGFFTLPNAIIGGPTAGTNF